MDIEQALLEEVRSLPREQQQEVLNFAAFLRQRAVVTIKKRIPGLHKDIPYRMADDFDAPLSDEFWLGDA